MTQLNIERIALRLHGVSSDIAQAALDGLDAELIRRLQMRGIDANELSGMASGLRLPSIHATQPLDAESLRAKLADGLIDLLAPATSTSLDTGGNN
ncbi:MAG: hypothetical protein B0W54_01630 [Cellvibrio sp. 79]|nr:MAG: hypothetical protein B0W54_01630 [Cellvibrio sp. 79]